MTFQSFEQNSWVWCDKNLIVVLVWFTRSHCHQLLYNEIIKSKKDVYLSQKMITEPQPQYYWNGSD